MKMYVTNSILYMKNESNNNIQNIINNVLN